MPADFHPHIGSWKIDILYESAELMAGDWLTYFRRDRTIWALCGDVVGKGPQAAIATSSLLTTLYNSSEESSSLADVIKRTDRSLSKIFKTSMVSTVAAAELLNEGTARLMAHGFMGWILLPVKGKARQIPGRGSSLGSGLISDIIFHEEQLAPGDRLLVFSDGVADGSRASHKIIKSLDGKCGQMTANEIMAAVVNIGRSSVTVDDKTMMILTYLP